MLDTSGNINAVRPCPHLGLAGDPSTSCLFVSDAHRCFRQGMPEQLTANHQSSYCVSGRYLSCPNFIPEGSSRGEVAGTSRGDKASPSGYFGWPRRGGEGSPSSELPDTQMGNYPGTWPRRNSKTAVTLVGTVGVLVVAGGLLVLSTTGENGRVSGASGGNARPTSPMPTVQQVVGAAPPVIATIQPASSSPAQDVSPTANPQPRATPNTTLRQISPATPTRSATALPTSRPVTTPTPVPTRATTVSNGQRSYVIARGDTLWSISVEFGVAVEEIVEANDLESESHIQAGQRIVIP